MPQIVSKQSIEALAARAAANGESIEDACPYPWASPAAEHFKAVYILALPNTAPLPKANP